ncbi:hypothetical protein FKM82_003282 [Ascaphus truei]
MASGCIKVTKYFLFLFNLLFFILGAVILGFGIWILVDKTSFISVLQSSSSSLKIGSYILIAVGGLTMVMGFLGCIGAVNEVRCLLGMYFTFLLIILIAQVAAGVLIYFQRDALKTEMSSIIHKLIVSYNYEDGHNTSTEESWDYIQKNLKCCGWNSYTNWTENAVIANSTRNNTYPCSCFTNENRTNGFCSSTVSLHVNEKVSPRVRVGNHLKPCLSAAYCGIMCSSECIPCINCSALYTCYRCVALFPPRAVISKLFCLEEPLKYFEKSRGTSIRFDSGQAQHFTPHAPPLFPTL